MKNLAIFGDSITWGKDDKENGGWVSLLRKYLEENNMVWGVYNMEIDGDNSSNLLKRFEFEYHQRKIDYLIFAVGINDTVYRSNKDNIETDINEYRKNIQQLIDLAKTHTHEVVFIGLTHVDEKNCQPLPLSLSSSWKYYSNTVIAEYNIVLKEVIERNKLKFLDVIDILSDQDMADRVDPNTVRHFKLFEEIKNNLIFSTT